MSALAIRDNAARATTKKATAIIEAQAAELAALRAQVAELQAARDDSDAFINASFELLRATVVEQGRRLEEARGIISQYHIDAKIVTPNDYAARAWLAANPAPAPRCTCGMGDATALELHASDCALNPLQADREQAE